MNCLELFCGTKSVGKLLEKYGYNMVSLDYNKKFNPTHCVNILEFDYKQYPIGHFDIIWASPDCRYYSTLQIVNIGKIDKATGKIRTHESIEKNRLKSDKLLVKIFEIISYFKPRFWFIENPQTGDMKNRKSMKKKPYYDADYCMYSDYGYRKRTRFWTNRIGLKLNLCNKKCGNMIGRRHKNAFGNLGEKQTKLLDRYRIPSKLLEVLLL